jgi:hypothetical protein
VAPDEEWAESALVFAGQMHRAGMEKGDGRSVSATKGRGRSMIIPVDLVDGLKAYEEITGQDVLSDALALYVHMEKELNPVFDAKAGGEACALAFVAKMLAPEANAACVVAVMDTRLVIGWVKGLIRMKPGHLVIPLASISSVSTSSDRGGMLVLRVQGASDLTVGIPHGDPALGKLIGDLAG